MHILNTLAVVLTALCCFTVLDGAAITVVEPATTTTTTPQPPTEVCKICKQMVAEARETLASNLTMDEMKQVFEGTCKILVPIKSLAAICEKYADELVPELVETLYEEMDPTRVCVTSGLCYASDLHRFVAAMKSIRENLVVKISKVLMKTDPGSLVMLAEQVNISDERVQNLLKGLCYMVPDRTHSGECVDAVGMYYNIIKSFLTTQVKSGSDCEICKMVLSYVESQVLDSSTEKDLENLLLKICPHVGEYEGECRAFIQQYTSQLWSIIVTAIKEQSFCTDVGFCSAQQVVQVPKVKIDECTICKDLTAEAKTELLSDEVIDALQSFTASLCDLCPTKDECTKYIDQNFATLYRNIISKLDPTIICKSLGVCSAIPSSKSPIVKVDDIVPKTAPVLHRVSLTRQDLSVQSGNEVECTVCKYVVHYIQTEIVQNKSVEYIKNELKKICMRLPSIGEECSAFVDTYAAALAQLLAHEVDPNNVCYKITNICTTQKSQQLLPVKSLKVTKCSVCQMAVDYIDHLMQEDKVDAKLTDLVDEVCKMMPKSTAKQCIDIVSTYGPSLIQYIGEVADSKEVCRHVSLCPKARLLGEKKCTYGPAYWCQDRAHAEECNAMKHCVERVWGKAI